MGVQRNISGRGRNHRHRNKSTISLHAKDTNENVCYLILCFGEFQAEALVLLALLILTLKAPVASCDITEYITLL